MKRSSIIFGASSEIGCWIKNALHSLNKEAILIGRSQKDSSIVVDSYRDLNNIKQALIKLPLDAADSIYFCPGSVHEALVCDSDPSDWKEDILVNLYDAYICYKAIFELTKGENACTKLIYLGSTSVISKRPGLSSYSVSKMALEGLVNYINNEQPQSIRACTLRLGTCKTKFSGSQNDTSVVSYEDIKNVVEYLEKSSIATFPELISIRAIKSSVN